MNPLIIFCTCPDQETATRIAGALVDQGLAACVNLLPNITSVYRWEGKRQTTQELLMLIKAPASRYRELEQAIMALHPYELPELIAVPVSMGLAGYLDWIDQCTDT